MLAEIKVALSLGTALIVIAVVFKRDEMPTRIPVQKAKQQGTQQFSFQQLTRSNDSVCTKFYIHNAVYSLRHHVPHQSSSANASTLSRPQPPTPLPSYGPASPTLN